MSVLKNILEWGRIVGLTQTKKYQDLYYKLVQEELDEFQEEFDKGNLKEAYKEFGDLMVVVTQHAYAHGYDLQEIVVKKQHENWSKFIDITDFTPIQLANRITEETEIAKQKYPNREVKFEEKVSNGRTYLVMMDKHTNKILKPSTFED